MRTWLSNAGSFYQRDHHRYFHFFHPIIKFKHFFQMTCIICFISLKFNNFYCLAICPNICNCKWTDGKETISCKNTNFTQIPDDLDPAILILDFEGNQITTLISDSFKSAGLLNLQRIHLIKSGIRTIDEHAFRSLKNLIHLDLSYNRLIRIPSNSFNTIPELRELKLNGNPILKIGTNAFSKLSNLRRLEISNCSIGYVDITAFSGLENTLEILKLDYNRLETVQPAAFTLLHALHGIELHDNPWNCSCPIRPLRHWLLQRTVPLGESPTCKYPTHNSNKSWIEIPPENFACLPKISAISKKFDIFEGDNITLSCHMNGSPSPTARWILRNRVLLNGNFEYPVTNKKPYVMHSSSVAFTNLTILSLELQDTGTYVCIAENIAGKAAAEIKLTVHTLEKTKFLLSEKVVIIGILLTAIIIVIFCSFILLIRVMYIKPHPAAAIPPPPPADLSKRFNYEDVIAKLDTSQTKPMTKITVPENKTQSSVLYKRDIEYDSPIVNAEKKPIEFPGKKDVVDKPSTLKTEIGNSPRNSMFDSHIGEMALQHHVLHKKELPTGNLYTTAMSFLTEDSSGNYPYIPQRQKDVETPKSTTEYYNRKQRSNTMPRNYGRYNQQSRRIYSSQSAASESQSSLLRENYASNSSDLATSPPSYRYPRSDYRQYDTVSRTYAEKGPRKSRDGYYPIESSTSFESRRYPQRSTNFEEFSKDTSPPVNYKKPSHPIYNEYISPIYSQPQPLVSSKIAATTYDYHSAQLERFLDEYRQIQSELTKMKESCEKLNNYPSISSRGDSREKMITSKGSLERSVSFVPDLKESSIRTISDENFVPKSILKKSQQPSYHGSYTYDISDYNRPNTSPMRRKHYRQFSNSSMDETYYSNR